MGIHVLDQGTINKIAAGEVIDRPASVVKELMENAIDAKATAVTVEIRDGGTSFIRITDNGCGIPKNEIPMAFLRHSTSKIKSAEDLLTVSSLGFRGEALSSIAAVGQVELITKIPESLTGIRYLIDGGVEHSIEEVGAPDGTTFIIRNLFFNTPARRKFLKTPTTEAGYISDVVEKIALSHPDVSIRFINNNQNKLHTSGNGNLKDILYNIYGRDIARNLLFVESNDCDFIKITGFIGKPIVSRGNRNFENYYINGRFIKNNIIAKAIEDAYKPYMMQHRYPFTALHFTIDRDIIDVNVHPSKMELRIQNGEEVYKAISSALTGVLSHKEYIPAVEEKAVVRDIIREAKAKREAEPFEVKRAQAEGVQVMPRTDGVVQPKDGTAIQSDGAAARTANGASPQNGVAGSGSALGQADDTVLKQQNSVSVAGSGLGGNLPQTDGKTPLADGNVNVSHTTGTAGTQNGMSSTGSVLQSAVQAGGFGSGQGSANAASNAANTGGVQQDETKIASDGSFALNNSQTNTAQNQTVRENTQYSVSSDIRKTQVSGRQMEMFGDEETGLLNLKNVKSHKIIGQLFSTYWLVEFEDNLFIIDQHAAHEKVLYEKFMKRMQENTVESQNLMPPIVISLSLSEENALRENMEVFTELGFEIDNFGGREYTIGAVPVDLYGMNEKEMFTEILDELVQTGSRSGDSVKDRIATMACKAAVKGHDVLSVAEARSLIDQLLLLENPYNCPHGRPTIISMSKYEMEKKFKRIV